MWSSLTTLSYKLPPVCTASLCTKLCILSCITAFKVYKIYNSPPPQTHLPPSFPSIALLYVHWPPLLFFTRWKNVVIWFVLALSSAGMFFVQVCASPISSAPLFWALLKFHLVGDICPSYPINRSSLPSALLYLLFI